MKFKKLIGAGILLLLIVGGVVAAGQVINAPSSGSIIEHRPPAAQADRLVPVRGKYVSFSYPSSFTLSATDLPIAPVVEQFSYVRHQEGSWQLGITVTHLATGSLEDNGTYLYRNRTTDRFTRANRVIGGQSVVVFGDTSQVGFSKVGYLQHGNLSASVSLQSATIGGMEQLQPLFEKIIASIMWL